MLERGLYMKQELKMAQTLAEKNILDYRNLDRCFPVYMFATENVLACCKRMSLAGKNVLTVCSSSDQLFQFLLSGAERVDTYDINLLTKYFFYLKEAAVRGVDLREFLTFFFPKNLVWKENVFSEKIYLKIREKIRDQEALRFWDGMFSNYTGKALYESELFTGEHYSKKINRSCNQYLKDKEHYYRLRECLERYRYQFYCCNILEDPLKMETKYDYIYLSNIFDYLRYNEVKDYVQKVKEVISKLEHNLTKEGMIGVAYLYCYLDEYWFDSKEGMLKSQLVRMHYFDEHYRYIDFPGVSNFGSGRGKDRDALMLYRRK